MRTVGEWAEKLFVDFLCVKMFYFVLAIMGYTLNDNMIFLPFLHFRKVNYYQILLRCSCQVADAFKMRYGQRLDLKATAFNAGFFIANLHLLRLNDEWMQEEFHFWMNVVRIFEKYLFTK